MIFTFNELVGKENTAIIVISLSPQKTHLVVGLETGQFLFIHMSTLQEIMQTGLKGEKLMLPALDPIKAHYQEIIEVKWADSSSLWATGSKDGRCCLWELKGDQVALANTLSVNRGQKGRKKRNFSCTYICWNCTYSHFAAGFQENVD
jgi:WD40 repeat protein